MYIKDLKPGDILFYGKNNNFKHVEIVTSAEPLINSFNTCGGMGAGPYAGVREKVNLLVDEEIVVVRCKDEQKAKEAVDLTTKWIKNGVEFLLTEAYKYLEFDAICTILACKDLFNLDNKKIEEMIKHPTLYRVKYDEKNNVTYISYNLKGKSENIASVPDNHLEYIIEESSNIASMKTKNDYEKYKCSLLKVASRKNKIPTISKTEESGKNGVMCHSFLIWAFQTAYLGDRVNPCKIWSSDKKANLTQDKLDSLPEFYKKYLHNLEMKGISTFSNYTFDLKLGIEFWNKDKYGEFNENSLDFMPEGLKVYGKTANPKSMYYSLINDKDNFEIKGKLSSDVPLMSNYFPMFEKKYKQSEMLHIYRLSIGQDKRDELREEIKEKIKI